MNDIDMEWIRRERVFVNRVIRYTRLATWLMAFVSAVAVFVLLLMLISVAAWAGPGSVSGTGDPRAAAADLGRTGQAAAGAIARDATSASEVPGYAGTDVPEKNLTAGAMEDAARQVLADPDDLGGAAGRAVIEGTLKRPSRTVDAGDPEVVRADIVATNPQHAAHGASGLASGSIGNCTAGLGDMETGGACGGVTWCVGAGCETVAAEANSGFADSVTRLNMVLEMGGDEFDRESIAFFQGEKRSCRIKFGGLANCCKNSGLLVGLANCSEAEIELAKERNTGTTHYLGVSCAKRIFGVCITRKRSWCVFGSKLGRILHEEARPQLGIGWSSCRGFTVAEIESIDFDALDLSEFTENLIDGSMEPAISLPGAGDTQTVMQDRIQDFYERGQ